MVLGGNTFENCIEFFKFNNNVFNYLDSVSDKKDQFKNSLISMFMKYNFDSNFHKYLHI